MQSYTQRSGEEQLAVHTVADTPLLWKELKAIADSNEKLRWFSNISVGTAIGLGAGLSAGYFMSLFRYGALLTSSLVTFPVWQWVDPLPILETGLNSAGQKFARDGESDGNAPMDESLETLVS